MASYWLKRGPDAPVEGPYTGTQLKEMGAAGHIATSALVSADNVQWTRAEKVNGLFPAPMPVPQFAPAPPPPVPAPPPAPAPAPYEIPQQPPWPASDPYEVSTPPPPPPPPQMPGYGAPAGYPGAPVQLGYASGSATAGYPGKTRDVTWYVVVSGVIMVLGLIIQGQNIAENFSQGFNGTSRNTEPGVLQMIFSCVGLVAVLGLIIYWLVWIGIVHGEMRNYTGGQYPISPGKAVGFCFIPFFNLYWFVYVNYRLAQEVEKYVGNEYCNPALVIAFQVLSIFPGCCLLGMGSLFDGLTMRTIQNGLNEMWTRPQGYAKPKYPRPSQYPGRY